jgi:hypothetical protein
MVVESATSDKPNETDKDQHYYCCAEFMISRNKGKITEQTSSFTDDKYHCVIDGFGYSILENILYCPYCGSNLVGYCES